MLLGRDPVRRPARDRRRAHRHRGSTLRAFACIVCRGRCARRSRSATTPVRPDAKRSTAGRHVASIPGSTKRTPEAAARPSPTVRAMLSLAYQGAPGSIGSADLGDRPHALLTLPGPCPRSAEHGHAPPSEDAPGTAWQTVHRLLCSPGIGATRRDCGPPSARFIWTLTSPIAACIPLSHGRPEDAFGPEDDRRCTQQVPRHRIARLRGKPNRRRTTHGAAASTRARSDRSAIARAFVRKGVASAEFRELT